MSTGKKLRFEIFKRDNFACQYCGKGVPDVILEIDHIIPRVSGGGDEIENLLTACFDCNRGKAGNELGVSLLVKKDTQAEIEKIQQLEAYYKHIKKYQKIINQQVDQIELLFKAYFSRTLTDYGKKTVEKFLRKLPFETVQEAMSIAVGRKHNEEADYAFKYFCGICWNKIKGYVPPWKGGR